MARQPRFYLTSSIQIVIFEVLTRAYCAVRSDESFLAREDNRDSSCKEFRFPAPNNQATDPMIRQIDSVAQAD